MKKNILSIMFVVAITLCNAQIKFYKTYEDYIKKNSIDFKDFEYKLMQFQPTGLYTKFKLIDNQNNVVTLQNKDYWGFEYKNSLFRFLTATGTQDENRFFVKLVSNGKICYYENGLAYLSGLIRDKNTGFFRFSDGCFFFSKDLNSTIAEDRFGKFLNNPSIQQLFSENKEFESLYDCLLKDKPDLLKIKYNNDFGVKTKTKNGELITNSPITVYIMKLSFEYVRNCVKAFNNDASNLNLFKF